MCSFSRAFMRIVVFTCGVRPVQAHRDQLCAMPKPNKTSATKAGAQAFMGKQPKEEVRDDCRASMELMHETTGEGI
jgi:hypothetical protein